MMNHGLRTLRRLFSVDGPLPPILLPVCGALLTLAIAKGPVSAAETTSQAPKTFTFYIAAQSGYGLGDCLSSMGACGRIVADSWCSAKGYGKARAWGATEDMTASVKTVASRPPAGKIAITCAE